MYWEEGGGWTLGDRVGRGGVDFPAGSVVFLEDRYWGDWILLHGKCRELRLGNLVVELI